MVVKHSSRFGYLFGPSLLFAFVMALPFFSFFAGCPGPTGEETPKEANVWQPEGGEQQPEPTPEEDKETSPETPVVKQPYEFERVKLAEGSALYHMANGSAVQLVAGSSIFLSEDKAVWLDIAPPALLGRVRRIAINGNNVLAVGGQPESPNQGQIMLSNNQGRSWESVWTIKKDQKDARLRAVMWITETIALVVGYQGQVYRTVDSGATFTSLPVANSMEELNLEAMALVGNKLFVVGDQGSIFLSEDNGASWKVLQQESGLPTLRDVTFFKDTIAFAVGARGSVYRTEDAGLSWSKYTQLPLPEDDDDLRAVASDGANRMAIVSRKYYYFSLNKGNSWDRISLDTKFLPSSSELLGAYFADKDTLYLMLSDGYLLKGTYRP
ncbi:MAG: hypothetical protein H6728_04660 [Myxococcales bacterium]|nr:hypothetical protein [Myxococcales bacterium]MCB9642345.1 hypothetical protein [Myxococcales bacterium]